MSSIKHKTLRHAALAGAACLLGGASVGLASCSLGLDESLIGQGNDAAYPDVQQPDTATAEDADAGSPPVQVDASTCTKDEDCKTAGGCLAAKCDVPRKACVFHVCRQPACNSATCDVASQKCGAAKPYKYHAAQFPVGAQIGCGGALGSCFAVVYPYVFVGTTNGVVAFPASDPQNDAPAALPVTGLGFVPRQILASGSRVFFLGGAAGTGATSRIALAYVDVSPDPFATKIVATTVLAGFNRPASDGTGLAARGGDTALLIDTNAATAYASVPVEPPLTEPVNLASTGFAFTAGATPLAMSGTRLVMGQISATSTPSFGFVNGAGGGAPQTVPDVSIATATPASPPEYFAQSADGAVFWAYAALTSAQPGPPVPLVRAVRGYFLVGDGAASFDPAAGFDIETYGGGVAIGSVPTVGPVALLDSKTAMVTTSNPANTAQTNVQFITRGPPIALVKNADTTPRRFALTLPVGQLAAAGSNGLGYVLAVDPAAPTAPVVHVFDPGCIP